MKTKGYTLIEVMVAVSLSILVIGGVMASLTHVLRSWRETQITNELNSELEIAMEQMRHDMRLSSIGVGLMSFYPAGSAQYSAISFPMAADSDGDGLLDRDSSGKLRWTSTVIYHVLASTPNEFRRTVFFNRNQNVSSDLLYQQLKQVAEATSESEIIRAAMAGEECSTRAIFKNLTHLAFFPPNSLFDGYAPNRQHSTPFNFGSIVLAPGFHTITFKVTGKNPDSSGYHVEIDRFRLGRARGAIEAEAFIPQHTHPKAPLFSYSSAGGSVNAEDMADFGGQWSGNAQAKFTGTAEGSEITFEVYDDMWFDSNFNEPGAVISSNCSVKWDTSFRAVAPYIGDKVVSMDKGTAWTATACGDTEYTLEVTNSLTAYSMVYGSGLVDDMAITLNGCWTRFYFERPANHALNITEANITDLYSGDNAPITFNNGNASVTVSPIGSATVVSDWIPMWKIERQKSYVITIKSSPTPLGPCALSCQKNNDGIGLAWVNGSWQPYTVGISSIEVGYPEKAIYRSGIFDTHCEDPAYTKLFWTQIEKFNEGGDIDIRVRSGNSPDLSDGSWTDAKASSDGYFQSNNGNNLALMPNKRYVQYEAQFRCGINGHTDAYTNAPTAILRDVSIMWTPPMGLVDLEVEFGMGPSCGIVEATVDGKPLTKSMVIELEICKEGLLRLQTARAQMEIKPLNTGK